MPNELPKITNKKKIDLKKFKVLAAKVKKAFEDEDKYLKEKYGDNTSSRLLTNH